MWKQLTASLAAAAMMTTLSLSAGDATDGKPCPANKDMVNCCCCIKLCPKHCKMQDKAKCHKLKKVVKITPVQKENDDDPGFIAIVEEYSFAAEDPSAPTAGNAQKGSVEHTSASK